MSRYSAFICAFSAVACLALVTAVDASVRGLKKAVLMALTGGLCLCLAAASVPASPIVLVHDNSQIRMDPVSQTGIYQWQVDGKNYLQQQWWWYRVGGTGPESSVDTLNLVGQPTLTDSNGDGVNDTAVIDYADLQGRMTLELTHSLRGGVVGSGVSDLGEQILVQNTSLTSRLDLHLFQYVHMALSSGSDSVEFDGKSLVMQTDSTGAMYAEEVVTGRPQHHEANVSPVTLTKLNDNVATILNDSNSAGPGDVTWAFQWDLSLAPGASYIISKDKTLTVPEPATLALLGGGVAVALVSRRKK